MSTAWVLDFGQGRRAAVAQRQQLHLMHTPEVQALAFAPVSAKHVLLWNGRCLPVLDFGSWRGERPTADGNLLGVYAYTDPGGGSHRLGALWLSAPPVVAKVNDEQACELPTEREEWRGFSASCYHDERFGAVPIIDLARVFEAPPAPISG